MVTTPRRGMSPSNDRLGGITTKGMEKETSTLGDGVRSSTASIELWGEEERGSTRLAGRGATWLPVALGRSESGAETPESQPIPTHIC